MVEMAIRVTEMKYSNLTTTFRVLVVLTLLILVGVQLLPAPSPSDEMMVRVNATIQYYKQLELRLRDGEIEAISELTERMKGKSNTWQAYDLAREMIVGAIGKSDHELLVWLSANKKKFYFDNGERKYKLIESTPDR